MILVVGASGRLGGRITRLLLARHDHVRAMSRDPAGLAELESLGAEVIRADLTAGVYMDTADQMLDMTETLKHFPVALTRLEDVVRARYGTPAASAGPG